MSARPLFNPDAKCPKCGHDEVSTSYQEDSHDYGCIAHRPYGEDGAKLGDRHCFGCGDEHFHRCCRRCHFEWVEAVLEATT